MEFFEVIVIDNGSTDNTRQVVESFQQKLRNIRYFYDSTPGLHVGRHLGMKMAKSDILVYADDDIEAFPTWLQAIDESFQNQDVVLVGGKNLPKFEEEPPEWIKKMWARNRHGDRILWYLSILDLGNKNKIINPYYVFGCNFSIRRNVLLDAGGFHPDAMPQKLIRYRGDGESHVSKYVIESGRKAFYNSKASVYHQVPSSRMREEYFVVRAYNQGISDSYTYIRSGLDNSLRLRVRLLIRVLLPVLQFNIRKIRFQKAYLKGYSTHRKEAMNNRSLYDWVTKDNYY
jgi:glycosyltransferase involved in cell wall biosynthesis